jgi:hypothetical protein
VGKKKVVRSVVPPRSAAATSFDVATTVPLMLPVKSSIYTLSVGELLT